MEAKTKQEYIEAWERHVCGLWTLALCHDKYCSDTVSDCIKKLMSIIPEIAKSKYPK